MSAPAPQGDGAQERKRVRKPASKETTRRSYFVRQKWPRFVRDLRRFAADPHGLSAGTVLAILTPLLFEPVMPVYALPTRRTVTADDVAAGDKLANAFHVAQWQREQRAKPEAKTDA